MGAEEELEAALGCNNCPTLVRSGNLSHSPPAWTQDQELAHHPEADTGRWEQDAQCRETGGRASEAESASRGCVYPCGPAPHLAPLCTPYLHPGCPELAILGESLELSTSAVPDE